jgi:hypothetical protein
MAAAPPIIAASLWPDPKVERSIFGTADPEAIWEQVLETCPEAMGCFAFRVSIGALFGLELRDESRVALKIHTGAYSTSYLAAAQAVQEHLWRRGFPCPRPLGGRGRATLEEWREDGVYRDGHVAEVRRALAIALARLIELTDELRPLPRLQRGFAFPRRVTQLWPTPHNVLFDFEATSAGAEWIDEIAAAALAVRHDRIGREVVGHGDWVANHVRFDGAEPCVAYDWDSLETDREPNLLGGADGGRTACDARRRGLRPRVRHPLRPRGRRRDRPRRGGGIRGGAAVTRDDCWRGERPWRSPGAHRMSSGRAPTVTRFAH